MHQSVIYVFYYIHQFQINVGNVFGHNILILNVQRHRKIHVENWVVPEATNLADVSYKIFFKNKNDQIWSIPKGSNSGETRSCARCLAFSQCFEDVAKCGRSNKHTRNTTYNYNITTQIGSKHSSTYFYFQHWNMQHIRNYYYVSDVTTFRSGNKYQGPLIFPKAITRRLNQFSVRIWYIKFVFNIDLLNLEEFCWDRAIERKSAEDKQPKIRIT